MAASRLGLNDGLDDGWTTVDWMMERLWTDSQMVWRWVGVWLDGWWAGARGGGFVDGFADGFTVEG